MYDNIVNNMSSVEKTHYKYSDQKVIVGGYYLNDLLLHQNNGTVKGGGGTAIYSKLEKYGIPAGLYVSPVSNNIGLHKIETIIVEKYDFENTGKLLDNLDKGVIKNIHNNTRKKEVQSEVREKKKQTRKR